MLLHADFLITLNSLSKDTLKVNWFSRAGNKYASGTQSRSLNNSNTP